MTFASRRLHHFLLPLLSGFLLTFAYPLWNFEAAVWLWLFPLLYVLWPLQSDHRPLKRPYLLGFLTGLAFFIPNLLWLRHSSRVIAGATTMDWIGWGPELQGLGAVVGLSIYCALHVGLWAWFTHRFARPDPKKLASAPWQVSTLHSLKCAALSAAAWVAMEWVRTVLVLSGFGWNGLGVAMHQNTILIQAADLVGVAGLSFIPVFIACTAWNTITRVVLVFRGEGTCRSRLDFTFAMVLLLLLAGYGMHRVNEAGTKQEIEVRTVLVQTNVPQIERWSRQTTSELYQQLGDFTHLYGEARDGKTPVDVIIWPESAVPIPLYSHADHPAFFNDLLSLGDFTLITGIDVISPDEPAHTSVALFRKDFDSVQLYHKMHLVPFGEYLPFRDTPPFSFLKGVIPGDFTPGEKAEPLQMEQPRVQIIPLICFEDTVGHLARRFVRPEPQFIVNVTNDGWFLDSAETEVHLANAKFRAIELRRPMCRAANTGVTCFIDTAGRITSRLADPATGNTFIEGCLPGEITVPRHPEITLYARFGDWFAITCLLCVGLVTAWGLSSRFRKPASSSASSH